MTRQDAQERVSGQAEYTRDIYLPGMLYAKILTSPYAHAKITSMDSSQAEALVGVRDILKFEDPDIAKDFQNGAEPNASSSASRGADFFGYDRCRYGNGRAPIR